MSPRLNIPCISPQEKKLYAVTKISIPPSFYRGRQIDHNDIPKLNYLSLLQSKG